MDLTLTHLNLLKNYWRNYRMEKTVSEAIKYRRSVRKFDPSKELNSDIVKKCIENGVAIFSFGNFIILPTRNC